MHPKFKTRAELIDIERDYRVRLQTALSGVRALRCAVPSLLQAHIDELEGILTGRVVRPQLGVKQQKNPPEVR